MARPKKSKVIFDTNIWISFLIGKRLGSIKDLIADGRIQMVLTDQLFTEIELVTQRPKLQKYFKPEQVQELLQLLQTIGKLYQIKPKHTLSRDEKDSFLLDLIDKSKADYLVTGDNDLLELGKFKTAVIISPKEFEKAVKQNLEIKVLSFLACLVSGDYLHRATIAHSFNRGWQILPVASTVLTVSFVAENRVNG